MSDESWTPFQGHITVKEGKEKKKELQNLYFFWFIILGN